MNNRANKIYKLTNIINLKVYIGTTIRTLKKRLNVHRAHAKSCINFTNINKAIRELGADNFNIELIEECKCLDEALEREKFWIFFYDSINNGYNMTTSGINRKVSDETKYKIGIGNKGKKLSDATKEKISRGNKGKTSSLGRSMNENTKNKLSAANRGKKQTPEHIEKVRIGLLNYYKNGGWHPRRGKHLSEKHKELLCSYQRKYSNDELMNLAIRWEGGEKIKEMLRDFPQAKNENSLNCALRRGKILLKNKSK